MKKLLFLAVVVLAVVFNQQSALAEKQLTYIFNFSTNILDPAVDRWYMPLRAGVLETLAKVDNESLEVLPWLAESWESDDAVNWEFRIKPGIQFSDGSPCDAKAVQDSIERLISKSKGLKNTLKIASMVADGQILKIVTTEVHPGLPSDFAHPQTAILKADAPNPDVNPIGTGPFIIVNFTPHAQIELVKNKNYWDGDVKLDKANFVTNQDGNSRLLSLQAGQADIIFKPASESLDIIKATKGLKVDAVKGIRVHNLIYNISRPLTQSADFRKGIDALINRQEIVDTIMMGMADPAKGPFVEEFSFAPEYADHSFGFDTALGYFKAAGMKIKDKKVYNPDGSAITLKFVSYTSQPEFPAITQVIQANAMQIGINLKIHQVDNIDNWLSANNDWDLTMYSVFAVPRGDAGYYLNAFIYPPSPYNYGHIADPEMTNIIHAFNIETDSEKRIEHARKAAEMIDDANYISYICYPRIVSAFNTKVKGWVTSRMEYYMLTKDLDIE